MIHVPPNPIEQKELSVPKITIVGAGGYVFPLTLIRDILAFEALQDSELCLYDPDAETTWRSPPRRPPPHRAHGLATKLDVPAQRRRPSTAPTS